MNWLAEHWQTLGALTIVVLTVVIFVVRLARPGKSGGCEGGCSCDAKELGQGKVESKKS